MTLENAIEIVLCLATENILTEGDARDNELEEERLFQLRACAVVEDFAVNVLAEGRVNFPEKGAA